MSGSVWIDERPRRLGWLAPLLGVLAVLLVALATTLWRDEPRTLPAASAVAPGAPAAVPQPAAPAQGPTREAARAVVPTPPAPLHCPYQQLDLVPSDGPAVHACVAATRVSQSGDLRSYLLEPQGVSEWTLRIDTGDGAVRAASLSAPGRGEYRCDDGDCPGFAIGPRDAQGGRTLTLRGALLTAAALQGGGAAASPVSVSIGARLQVPSDQQDPTLACGVTHIAIVERSGAVLALCPSDGGGMVLAADGRRVYSLRGPAGDTLLVGVDASGAVDQVQIGELACQGLACGGVTTQPGPDPGREGGRLFSFSGTTVSDGRSGGHSATLNGSAVLPEF